VNRVKPPQQNISLYSGAGFDFKGRGTSGFGPTISAMMGDRYDSIMTNFSFGGSKRQTTMREDGSLEIWTPYTDENTRDLYTDPRYSAFRSDLAWAKTPEHFYEMVNDIDNKFKNIETIKNSSWTQWLVGAVVDPVNLATIFIPIARTPSVWKAINTSIKISAGTVAPIEALRAITDPTVGAEEAVVNTALTTVFAAGVTGAGKSIFNSIVGRKALAKAETETRLMLESVQSNETVPIYRTTEGGEIVGAKDGSTLTLNTRDDFTIPTIKDPEGIARNAYIDSWLFQSLTSPEKRVLLDDSLDDSVKADFNKMFSSFAFQLNKNKFGVASTQSVHLKASMDRGIWAELYEDFLDLYTVDTNKKVGRVLDYNITGTKDYNTWLSDLNFKYVTGQTHNLSSAQKSVISKMTSYWKDWGKKLESVGLIGTRGSLLKAIEKNNLRITELENALKQRETGASLGMADDIAYYKRQITKVQNELKEDQLSLDNIGEVMPTNELFYLPRFWHHDKIKSNRLELEEILTNYYEKNPYVNKKGEATLLPFDRKSANLRAKQTVDNILNDEKIDFDSTYSGVGSMHTRHRALDIPNELVWDFIEQNPIKVMQAYTSKISAKYHYLKEMGESFESFQERLFTKVQRKNGTDKANAVLRDFTAMYNRVVGNVLDNPGSWSQMVRTGLVDLAQFNYLGSAGFATLTDYAAIFMQRDMGHLLKFGFAVLDGNQVKLNAREGKIAGEALEIILGDTNLRLADDITNNPLNRSLYDKTVGKAKHLYFALNLLGPATNVAKRFEASLRAHQSIFDCIEVSKNTKYATSKIRMNLAKQGFTAKAIKEIAEKAPWEQSRKGGFITANSSAWLEAGVSQETLNIFRANMNAGLFNTVIMASPTDKPLLMDGTAFVPWKYAKFVPGMKESSQFKGYSKIENGLLALPFTFYSYSLGAANKITAAMTQGTLHNRAMGIMVGMGLAYMGLQLRYRNKPYILDNMTTQDKILRAFDYSGIASIYSDIFYKTLATGANLGYPNNFFKPKYVTKNPDERPVDIALEFGGAGPSIGVDYYRSLAKLIRGDYSDGTKELVKSLPFARLWFLESFHSELGRQLNKF
tara:strand:- start:230 stop:3520 length:3291 start_codon:yes stop_codon:yes gene_type:complete